MNIGATSVVLYQIPVTNKFQVLSGQQSTPSQKRKGEQQFSSSTVSNQPSSTVLTSAAFPSSINKNSAIKDSSAELENWLPTAFKNGKIININKGIQIKQRSKPLFGINESVKILTRTSTKEQNIMSGKMNRPTSAVSSQNTVRNNNRKLKGQESTPIKTKRKKQQIKIQSQHNGHEPNSTVPDSISVTFPSSNNNNSTTKNSFTEEELQNWLPTAFKNEKPVNINKAIEIKQRSEPLFEHVSREVEAFSDETDNQSDNDNDEEEEVERNKITYIRQYVMKSVPTESKSGSQLQTKVPFPVLTLPTSSTSQNDIDQSESLKERQLQKFPPKVCSEKYQFDVRKANEMIGMSQPQLDPPPQLLKKNSNTIVLDLAIDRGFQDLEAFYNENLNEKQDTGDHSLRESDIYQNVGNDSDRCSSDRYTRDTYSIEFTDPRRCYPQEVTNDNFPEQQQPVRRRFWRRTWDYLKQLFGCCGGFSD